MKRKLIYACSLAGFFFMWGIFGFTSIAPGGETKLQAATPVVESTSVAPGTNDSVGIPVTGDTEPLWTEIVVFYGLIGLTAMFLVLALLSLANKSTAPYLENKSPPSEEIHKH